MSRDTTPGPREVAKTLGNGTAAVSSCATALHIALRHLSSPFTELHRFVVACKGDVDTIGAMAGALWGAANGDAGLPPIDLEARECLEQLALRLFELRK
jgi:ADP-ribosylglycohydrolase